MTVKYIIGSQNSYAEHACNTIHAADTIMFRRSGGTIIVDENKARLERNFICKQGII